MKLTRIFSFIFIFTLLFGSAQSVFAAGNISNTSKYSQFLNIDLDNNATNDFIN